MSALDLQKTPERARQLITKAINQSQTGDHVAARETMREVGQFIEGYCDEEVEFR